MVKINFGKRSLDQPDNLQVSCPTGLLYGIRQGDTLFILGQRFDVTVQALQAANPSIDPRNLQIGQIICIPEVTDRICPRGRLRTVQRGETLSTIARQEGIPLEALIEANKHIPDPDIIFPGEQICIPTALKRRCCLVLEPTQEAMSFDIGGVFLNEELNDTSRITFTGVNLPDPSAFGDFNAYQGNLVFREIEVTVHVAQATLPDQPPVYSGAKEVDVPPLGANIVVIYPLNTETDTRGSDILRGRIIDCR